MKEKFGKPLKVSKYYEDDCLQNFFLLFMFFLITNLVKNIHIRLEIFPKTDPNQTGIKRQRNDRKSCYQVTEDFDLFYNLIALYLG